LKLEFGIILGEKIQLVYDGILCKDEGGFVFEEIELKKDNPKGLEFVNLFDKKDFNIARIEKFVIKKLNEIEETKTIKHLKHELTSGSYENKLKELLKIEYLKEYSESVVQKTLSEIDIKIYIKTNNEPNPEIKNKVEIKPSNDNWINKNKKRESKSIDQHLEHASKELKELFYQLDSQIKRLSSNIEQYTEHDYIAYRGKNSKRFIEVYIQKGNNEIKFLPKSDRGRIDIPNNLNCKELIKRPYGPNFVHEIRISPGQDIGAVMEVIAQSCKLVLEQ
jgi:predicted transport protein